MTILNTRDWFEDKDDAAESMIKVAKALTDAGLGSEFGVRMRQYGEGYQVLVIKRNVV